MGAICVGGRHAAKAMMMPTNEIALIAKTAAAPAHARTTPPMAGPTTRATFTETLANVAAAVICSRGTTSG